MNRAPLVTILPILGAVFTSADLRAQAVPQDPNSPPNTDAESVQPGSFFDIVEPPAPIDYSPPTPPTYDLSSRKIDSNGSESRSESASVKRATQEESIGRLQNGGGSMGLETERRLDPTKIGPPNDFVKNQREPDSFVGFSIVSPYDSK